ncbi:SpoIIE family protein phosphatase [Streptomyces niveiscabiei]|uniref:SpoIIE family protein phosphatase n=1 Tax=Streptomyces niveiscabiei TaxID=164115 RepID=UPI0029A0D547|nr:SpoIIE family protein phosphatase [Streptomyces niveiscabiei]MDX3384160.1 SpoIIE family protein phosphatase [Streptomyces niveiscabiei]
MGTIPTQRESAPRSRLRRPSRIGTTLTGSALAPGTAREVLARALDEWAAAGRHATPRAGDEAVLVLSELVTNAVVHAGTDVEISCRLEEPKEGAGTAYDIVVEVSDRHPSRTLRDGDPDPSYEPAEYGRGLRLVTALAMEWGVTYRRDGKTVWARLGETGGCGECGGAGERGFGDETHHGPHEGSDGLGAGVGGLGTGCGSEPRGGSEPCGACGGQGVRGPVSVLGPLPSLGLAVALAPEPRSSLNEQDWLGRGALSFLAEASDLLAGQLDEDLVAALTGQVVVPRVADWCAVWLEDETVGGGGRLARVWHKSEGFLEGLKRELEQTPPPPAENNGRPPDTQPYDHPWPVQSLGSPGTALAYRLVAGGRVLGTLVIGRCGILRFPDEVTGLVEDLSRRVALAIGAARQYARQVTISAVLQRGLLPGAVAEIPGVRSALVYEPREKGGPSGDFYDLFPADDGRWCFAIGDVQGKGPEAAVVIGLARPWLRLLAREGYGVADVLDRLNQLLLDDATEAADAAARAYVGPAGPGEGPQTRFLSLLYGELVPYDGGVRVTLASAGHPLPLLLRPDGTVTPVAQPQTLIGVVEDATYTSEVLHLLPGDSLLCVTDGVTERRNGGKQFDDGDGLAVALAGCAGYDAELIAERIQELVHGFGSEPPEDDLALLVLQAE